MFRWKSFLFATTAAIALPAAAMAQDWSGLYGGVTLGYGMGNADHSFSNGAPPGNSEPRGLLAGGFLGYAVQNGNMVWGGEIDIETSNFEGSYINTTGTTSQGFVTGNWQGSLRGVLGFAGNMGGNPALYYATAGWAVGEFDFLGGPSVPVPPGGGYSERLNGWTAGIGMDFEIAPNTALRAEYRYTDFGTANGTLAPAFPAITMPVDVNQHALRVGVRFNF
ncbi:outer membrane protein [Marimonas arenosa]|uniref:Outer membrane beta-barrel protein n=1 Tax=Marimonas arenosa TaxID=1795305 RepID=A0AAE3WFA6_9RHOB|nr:outer membrane beta-barrel protein [Marimonas arenosa]MDQ2091662.1 outer membrane beta-barrel protein [Marimonas arenosa]